jgi:hypothetical protein
VPQVEPPAVAPTATPPDDPPRVAPPQPQHDGRRMAWA